MTLRNPNPKNNGSDKGPLRKLIKIVKTWNSDVDMWELECGHQILVNTSTMHRARCWKCKKELSMERIK